MKKTLATLLTAMILVLCAGAANAGGVPSIAWAPCPDNPEGECGTLSVPLDWAKPRGQRIDLAVARHVATDPATVTRILPLTSICRYLERIGDHVKNLAEEVVYMVRAQDVRHRPPPRVN